MEKTTIKIRFEFIRIFQNKTQDVSYFYMTSSNLKRTIRSFFSILNRNKRHFFLTFSKETPRIQILKSLSERQRMDYLKEEREEEEAGILNDIDIEFKFTIRQNLLSFSIDALLLSAERKLLLFQGSSLTDIYRTT